ncbi:ficolin-1 [Plakobranchus ocellatus]|uniref:Ficolin-1 n=1 Tax=Plakobranchus ocellatus TaxID=259542 RepID=A0AAV3Y6Y7_9GAST|nr:ficolin-1 [Plakobranchus ocellatus]
MNTMKSEALSTALLIVLCCTSCSEGMRLVLHREIPKLTGARNTCGILRCEENVIPASTGSSPDGGFDAQDSSSSIFNMTIFKNQPSNSMAFGDEQKNRIAVALLTSEHPNITNVTESLKIIGILKNKSATVWLEMFRHDDCSSDFICEVCGLDSKGRIFLSTSTLVQQKRETYSSDGDVDLTTSLQLLAQQLDTKLAIVSNSLSEVENKMEDKILSFERRIEGKIESAVTDIRDRLHSLENRLEDKIGHQVDTLYQIDAKVSAMNENDACSGNEDVSERLLTGVKNELSDALGNAVGIIRETFDVRFSSSQMHLTQNLTDSITEVVLSHDDTLKGTLDKIVSSQMVSLQSVRELKSNIYNITSNTPSVPNILSQINNTMMRSFKSVMTDILTPSDCKRGMFRSPSNYPFPHTVVFPSGKSGQGLPYLCDMYTDGGGWIVIQRRSTGNVDFYRDWATYKKGFGTLDDEFWLGNERIHALTSSGIWELRVDLKYKGKEAFAQYSNFSVESESNKYRLRIGSYSGHAGDSLTYHNWQKFSTFDNDNDDNPRGHCARSEEGGWWYGSCDTADLNRKWNGGADKGLEWDKFAGSGSASFSEMKIRRVS